MKSKSDDAPDNYVCLGNCHCGRIQFAVKLPSTITAQKCNCSICTKTGFVHLLVQKEDFELLKGDKQLAEYRFNKGIACHLFCKRCGVKSFYVPRSHPHGFSVNLNCVKLAEPIHIIQEEFNGREWSQNIDRLKARTPPDT